VTTHVTCQDVLDALYELIDCEECDRRSGLIDAGSPAVFSSVVVTDMLRGDLGFTGVVITADGSWINGKVFPMKKIVDDAVRFSPTVQNVIVVRNTATEAVMDPIRDHWYHELCKLPIAKGRCETVQVDAEDPLFILYTSGSTGKPKAILHSHGGYQVGTYATLHDCFDVHDADRRHVGLDVALDRVGSETRRELDDLGAGPCDDARRLGDGAGHRTGGVHVDCEDLHGLALLTHEPVSGTAPLQTLDL